MNPRRFFIQSVLLMLFAGGMPAASELFPEQRLTAKG